ncbi:21156_t:CDS:2 [Gigaspora rosea]|nr:21156_t:CDS:2 [Gigaspora rosea]
MLNIEVIIPEQREELQELLKADNELTKENQELKNKVTALEKELNEIGEVITKMEQMSEQYHQEQEFNEINCEYCGSGREYRCA